MTIHLAAACSNASKAPKDNTSKEEEYEEPKWTSIQGEQSADTSLDSTDLSRNPSQTTERQHQESSSQVPKSDDLDDRWIRLFSPLFTLELPRQRRQYCLEYPNDIDVRQFYAMPTRLAHVPGLATMPVSFSPVVWECEIQPWTYTICIRSFCNAGQFNSRLVTKFKQQIRIEYPGYSFIDLEYLPREAYGPFLDGSDYTPPCTSASCSRCISAIPYWYPGMYGHQAALNPSLRLVQQDSE